VCDGDFGDGEGGKRLECGLLSRDPVLGLTAERLIPKCPWASRNLFQADCCFGSGAGSMPRA